MELCKECHAGCCRRYNPYLWGSDIIRICENLKVDISFFTYAHNIQGEEIHKLKGIEPMFIFTDSGEEKYFVLILKANESKIYPDTSKCMFLQEWSAEALQSEELTGIIGRCGIYGIRPINCRAWPATYDEDHKRIVIRDPHLILDKRHKRIDDSHVFDICPRAMTHDDYSQYEDEYVRDAVVNYHEKQFFMQLADKWNQNPDVSDNFYEFLLKEYSNRIVHITNDDESLEAEKVKEQS